MTNYEYQELMDKTENELLIIKKEKQDELNIIRNRKLILVGGVMSLQNMAENEISCIKKERK